MRFSLKFLPLLFGWVAFLPALAAPPEELAPQLLDWQVYEQRPQGQVCEGYYLAPELNLPEPQVAFNLARLFSESNSAEQAQDKSLNLSGDVVLRRGQVYLAADTAQLNPSHELAQLEGQITLRNLDLLLRGASATYNLTNQAAQLNLAHYVMHQQRLRGSAWQLEQLSDGRLLLTDASLTSCAPQDNAWRLVASKIKLNQETGFGDAYNVRMQVQKVPIFYWPWLRFPIDDRRHTGLLAPSISWSKSSGLDYLQPIYINLAPNYDATLYPRQISKRGFLMGGEFRYLTAKNKGQLYYAQINNDKEFNQLNRWQFSAQHQGSYARLNYKLDFNQVSDASYLKDLKTSSFATASDELLQQLIFSTQLSGWQTRLNFQGYQKLHPYKTNPTTGFELLNLSQGRKAEEQDYFRLPQLEVSKSFALTENITSRLLLDLTHFSKLVDEEVTDPNRYFTSGYLDASDKNIFGSPDATRLRITPSLTANWRWPWAYVKPEAKLHYTRYKLSPYWQEGLSQASKNALNQEPSATVPVTSLDTGLFFERDTRLLGNKLLQTLEPRLFAAYVPYVEQQDLPFNLDGSLAEEDANNLFMAERTSGRDRVGDVQKITLGLTQRLINPSSSHQVASLSLAKAFYLEDRYLEHSFHRTSDANYTKNLATSQRNYASVRKTSSLAVQATFSPLEEVKLSSNLLWDDYFHKTEKANTYLTLKPFSSTQFNFGHIYTSEYQRLGFKGAKPNKDLLNSWNYLTHAEEQYYASVIYALNDNWRFFFKQSYDYKRSEKLDSLTGVEYNSCCWQLQLVYRDWIDNPDTSPAYNPSLKDDFARRERDYGIFVNFVFKGLGGVGQNIPELLTEQLQGYQSRP